MLLRRLCKWIFGDPLIPWIFGLITLQLLLVSWLDIKHKKISNLWLPLNLGLAISFYIRFQDQYPFAWAVLIIPATWIILGFILFVLGIMGAGDSKYLASLFLVIPPDRHMPMLEKIVYATLAVGIVTLLLKFLRDFQKIKSYAFSTHWSGLKESLRSKFSYAPVILLAWLLLGAQEWL